MKKIVIVFILLVGAIAGYGQKPTPIRMMAEVDSLSIALSPGLSLDGGNGKTTGKTLSNSLNIGFVLNALLKKKEGPYGSKKVFQQFIIDVNPIIIGWDPFTWNKLAKESVDSFSVNKLPFSEDALLNVGWHRISLMRILQGGKKQFNQLKYFSEFYYRPYNINKDTTNNRFAILNFNFGMQYGFLKLDIPTIKYFFIGLSAQLNYFNANESDAFLGSLKNCLGSHFYGKNYWGPGIKLTVQFKYLNVYAESRWYFAMDKNYGGKSFTHDPIIQVGAFADIPWTFKKTEFRSNPKPIKPGPDE